MNWERIVSYPQLQRTSRYPFKLQGKKLVLIDAGREQVYAVENVCPHQKYPLEDGILDLETQTLTCNHHFWKFNLNTGRCIGSGGKIAVYPAKVEDGAVWIQMHTETCDQSW